MSLVFSPFPLILLVLVFIISPHFCSLVILSLSLSFFLSFSLSLSLSLSLFPSFLSSFFSIFVHIKLTEPSKNPEKLREAALSICDCLSLMGPEYQELLNFYPTDSQFGENFAFSGRVDPADEKYVDELIKILEAAFSEESERKKKEHDAEMEQFYNRHQTVFYMPTSTKSSTSPFQSSIPNGAVSSSQAPNPAARQSDVESAALPQQEDEQERKKPRFPGFMTASEKLAEDDAKKGIVRPKDTSARRTFGLTRKPADTLPQKRPRLEERRSTPHGSDDEGAPKITDVNGVPLDDPRLRNLDPLLIERIVNEILDRSPAVTWNDIAGLDHAKKCIREAIIWPLLRPGIF